MPASLWKNRDFVLLITGRMVSQFGTAMTTFVIPWLLLQVTGSATQTGIAFAIGFLPYIFVSLPAGVWADQFNRKILMSLADLVRLMLLLAIPVTHGLSGQIPVLLLYVIQAGVSGFSAIFDAAYGACLPNLVDVKHLPAANNALQTAMSTSRIAGPIVGGMFVPLVGTANTIIVDVVSYVISIATMLAIVRSFSATRTTTTRNSFSQQVREGITTIWGIKVIRYLILFSTLVNFVGPGMDVALLYRIQHELHLPAQWAGIVMTGLSIGMVLGAMVNRRAGKWISLRKWLVLSSGLQVLPPLVLAFAQNAYLIFLVQIFIGILLVAWNVQTVTLRQRLIPDDLRGRSTSVFRLSAWLFIPLGDAIAGITSQHFGTVMYFLFAAAVLFLVAVMVASKMSYLNTNTEVHNARSVLEETKLS